MRYPLGAARLIATRLDDFLEEAKQGRHRGRGRIPAPPWAVGTASRDLGVHRNTLRYRLSRARDALGVDIEDPDIAARLSLLMRERGAA